MEKETEKYYFENIISGHKGGYLQVRQPDSVWPTFLKFKKGKVFTCHHKSDGSFREVPGDFREQLNFLSVIELDETRIVLKFENQNKAVRFSSEEKGFYYGR